MNLAHFLNISRSDCALIGQINTYNAISQQCWVTPSIKANNTCSFNEMTNMEINTTPYGYLLDQSMCETICSGVPQCVAFSNSSYCQLFSQNVDIIQGVSSSLFTKVCLPPADAKRPPNDPPEDGKLTPLIIGLVIFGGLLCIVVLAFGAWHAKKIRGVDRSNVLSEGTASLT